MLRFILCTTALCGALFLTACAGGSGPVTGGTTQSSDASNFTAVLQSGDIQAMCAATRITLHHCLGYSLTTQGLRRGYGGNGDLRKFGGIANNTLPAGYGPNDLMKAYSITGSFSGAGRVVALVESGDAPTLESDVSVYRAQYGLSACTTSNGCFSKIAQDGSANLPAYDPNWAGESQLDVDMVSALCPSCHILVVEASNEGAGLDIAENTAAQAGAFSISNSWGGSENASEASYFNHPGIAITVSSGDEGYQGGPQSPADFSTVIAVGGTTLQRANNQRGWSETVWSGTSGGCSKIVAKPAWQTDLGCSMRTIGDMAFDADPASGVAMYDGNKNDAGSGPVGWRVAGGTSVGAPAIAAIFALAGVSPNNASQLYANASALNDITSGSDGSCATAYLCHGEIGYDAPSGNGTPNGLSGL